jgi:hypothetical protein
MKLRYLLLCITMGSLTVSAETTLELLQQRAEAGDAPAQTLLGFMNYYGYQVPRNTKLSEEWYQRAAEQGDSIAEKQIKAIQQSSESALLAERFFSRQILYYLTEDELRARTQESSLCEERVRVSMEELTLNRASYVGKVVEIEFQAGTVYLSTGANAYLTAYGKMTEGGAANLILCGSGSLKWALAESKKGYGSISKVFALVDKAGVIALGITKNKNGDVYTYSW